MLTPYRQPVTTEWPTEFSPLKQQTEALNKIKSMAKERQLTPVLQTAQQIHQLDTSFLTSEDGVTLLLYIPLASEDTVFQLKGFTSFPLQNGDNVHCKFFHGKFYRF